MLELLEDFRYARWVKRLNRMAQVLLSLALVGGLNYVAARHYTRWDLTPTHRYSLSAETMAFLNQSVRENMHHLPDTPLELILVSQSDMGDDERFRYGQIHTLLKEYEDAAKILPGGNISLEMKEVDRDRDYDKATNLLKYSPLISLPEVIVKFGDRVRALTSADLYDIGNDASGKGLEAKAFRGENAITSAILDVVQTKADKIYFTIRHGEWGYQDSSLYYGLSEFGDALTQRNYKLGSIDLASEDIPADATVMVIVLPFNSHSAFLPEEQEKLRRYLNQRNGRILLFLSRNTDPGQKSGLEDLLHEWGLISPNLLVFESDPGHVTSQLFPIFNPVEDVKRKHPVTEEVARTVQSVIFGYPRLVEIDPQATEEAQHQVHELLATTKNSEVVPPDASGPNDRVVEKGSQVVAAISEKQGANAVGLPGGKLLVYGNADIISNFLFGQKANQLLMLNSVNYLANHENMLNIPPRAPKETKLDIPPGQLPGLGWRLALLPALMAIFGLGVCWVRYRS